MSVELEWISVWQYFKRKRSTGEILFDILPLLYQCLSYTVNIVLKHFPVFSPLFTGAAVSKQGFLNVVLTLLHTSLLHCKHLVKAAILWLERNILSKMWKLLFHNTEIFKEVFFLFVYYCLRVVVVLGLFFFPEVASSLLSNKINVICKK